ncbi:WD40-repeat-containing domain protein [Rhodotorula diobovata]|uniref:WD40-repeat-containing domain protein n=1 Tax=Rhodotorula diobovata TaxID=5288 RepID=A0A5C5G3B6_9BASI|nr:WD40-repeat-containing domain protein [Rhodotorula diobovata]
MAPAKRAPAQDSTTKSRTSKKQRTQKHRSPSVDAPEPQPALGDPSTLRQSTARPKDKDEEELELEEAVFGRRSGQTEVGAYDLSAEDLEGRGRSRRTGDFVDDVDYEDDDDDEETGLERMRDDSLFFVDVPPTASTSAAQAPHSPGSAAGSSIAGDSDSDEEAATATKAKALVKSRNLRQAAWHDPADENLQISLQGQKRLRKLRDSAAEDVVSGLEYESRLRRQFEKLHPPPQWAVDARRKILRRRAAQAQHGGNAALLVDSDVSDASDDGEEGAGSADERDEADELFSRAVVGGKGGKKVKGGKLEPGEIDIDRVRDANQHEQGSGPVVEIGFHPRAQVLFSATSDRRLRLFQVDGTDNPLLQTLHVPELPITSAAFHPSGSSILLTGQRPFFLSYDLQTGQTLRSPRGLLNAGLGGSDKASTGGSGSLERFRFSPGAGDVLALAGRRGYVHLVDWGSSGVSRGGQVLGEVKMNGAVKALAWQREGRELLTLGDDSEVYVWDIGTRKCVDRWKDDGGFGAAALETSRDGKWTAVGSTTGIVNVYDDASRGTYAQGGERKARKAVENLVTGVSTMRFNHDAQLLALASKTNKDQLKLVHLPTCSVYQNWPTQQTPLHHVTCVDFSKGSEWLAVGNQRGKVLLYEVKQFARGTRGRVRR